VVNGQICHFYSEFRVAGTVLRHSVFAVPLLKNYHYLEARGGTVS
jgi:hypothetical protein